MTTPSRVLLRGLRLSLRPVLGWLLAVVGGVALFLGWYGVSGTPIPAKQLPYLVSGGMTGVSLVVLAAAVLATDDVKRQLTELRGVAVKVDKLFDLLTEPVPDDAQPDPVRLDGGATYHRPACRLVAGKQVHVVTDKELSKVRPCRVCQPAA